MSQIFLHPEIALFASAVLLLLVRLVNFHRFTAKDLPRSTDYDRQEMCAASRAALFLFLAFCALYFLAPAFPLFQRPENKTLDQWRPMLAGVCSLFAWILDLKAERIKKRGRDESQSAGEVHWYHIFVAVFLPFLALPLGIINLFRKHFATGLTLILIPTFLGYLLYEFIVSPNGGNLQSDNARPLTSRPRIVFVDPPKQKEANAQLEAVRRYPQLGVANSPMNRAFVAEYNRKKANNPAFFSDPSWPLNLAKEVAR